MPRRLCCAHPDPCILRRGGVLLIALLLTSACGRPAPPQGDVVLSYRDGRGYCVGPGCASFELEFHTGGVVRYRGLGGCAVPGTHSDRIDPAQFDALVRAFHDARFIDIPRTDPSRRWTDVPVITIAYRDAVGVHETEDAGRQHPALQDLGRRLREAARVERWLTPTAELYARLLESGWDVNTSSEDGDTALSCAVLAGRLDAVRVLIDHGARVTRLALNFAAAGSAPELLALLLDAQPVDMGGPVAAEMVVQSAMQDGPMLAYLLDRGAGADAARAGGRTALMAAIAAGSLDNARLLLSRGAGSAARDTTDQSALHVAALAMNSGFIPLLTAHGADVNARDKEARTPLWLAASRCFDWNVRALLGAGADQSISSRDGRRPADVAAENRTGQACGPTRALLGSQPPPS